MNDLTLTTPAVPAASNASRSPSTGLYQNPWIEIKAYVGQIHNFKLSDWVRYLMWIGSIFGLFLGTTSFIGLGALGGIQWPGYVWFIPIGTFMFGAALAIDDIGHRTLYKNQLARGEGYVHQMIVATAIPSVMALCLCYQHEETFRIPAMVLILLSFFYSALDEGMHWFRYFSQGLDRVEMWSHFTAITGHALMIACWWHWLSEGYPGVTETLQLLP